MIRIPKVADIEDEENILVTKVKLTKNEYNATIRNKQESNRLKTIRTYMIDQNDMNTSQLRTTMHNLRKSLNDNQANVSNIDEFFINRKVVFSVTFYKS